MVSDMRTKLVYVLVSTPKDFFWEQCLISVMSAKNLMPSCNVTLVCDDITRDSLVDVRQQILDFIDEIIVLRFDKNIKAVERSRLIKVNLRNTISGDYLYIDCDTLIIEDLSDVDNLNVNVGAVLEGHCMLKSHPMINYFARQNKHLRYDFNSVIQYFNAGVMYVRDCKIAYDLYRQWLVNYKESVKQGSYIDQPPLSMSNQQLGHAISEIDGIWNCQVRFGALYLACAKILHFCSKKNMPVHILSSKDYLMKVKKLGKEAPMLSYYMNNWKCGFCSCIVSDFGQDVIYNLSQEYEKDRSKFIDAELKTSIYHPNRDLSEKIKILRNKVIGLISPQYLYRLLYKEKFGVKIDKDNYSINRMIYELTFYSDINRWPILADKFKVREFVSQCGFGNILPNLYGAWNNADDMDFSELPNEFVLKCNHDNGSVIIVNDKYSLSHKFIVNFFRYRLSKKFGIETAEPHYKKIDPVIIAEELIHNDKQYSDSLVSFKFFSFYGRTEYCQVVFNVAHHKNQRSIIYSVPTWEKKEGYIIKSEGSIDIPCPVSLKEMIRVVKMLSQELPFCRVDLYEHMGQIYFSELTFMPGCGRIDSFSKEFMDILGRELFISRSLWKQS